MLRFEHVTVRFDGRAGAGDVSFEACEGETRVILGAAGSGKTVLLKTALGLLKPDSRRASSSSARTSRGLQRGGAVRHPQPIGMLFQEGALFDSLTIEENVAYPLLNQSAIQLPAGPEVRPRVEEALHFVELGARWRSSPASFPAACGGAWPSRAPWSPARRCCSTIRPPPGWTRSRPTPSSR